MKSIFFSFMLFGLVLTTSLVGKADTFYQLVDGQRYKCTSEYATKEPAESSSCSVPTLTQQCTNSVHSVTINGCSVTCSSGKTAYCHPGYEYAGCGAQHSRCGCN